MQYRRLGRSGLQISALSFGSWVTFDLQLGDKTARECMEVAYEAGVNFFDNAEAYAAGHSEEIMGRVLKQVGWNRDTYCVSSKVYWGGEKPSQRGLSAKHVHDACHAALRRFQLDYLDLFFCHRPDLDTPIAETVRAMDNLIRQGKVLYWGTSEWSAVEIMEAHKVAREWGLTPPVMEQPQYNMLSRQRVEAEYHHLYETVGLGTTIWSPLASGILTGKYKDGVPEGSRLSLPGYEWLKELIFSPEGKVKIGKAAQLEPVAKELGVSLTRLAIAWCLKNDRVSTVILGASHVDQLRENLKAIDLVPKLDEPVMERIEKILDNKPPAPPRY